jgi:hypothetical protein
MKLTFALIGLTGLTGVALSSPASAMPIAPAPQATSIKQAAYVCNAWGRCWWRPNYYYGGYYGPRFYGGWGYRRWGWGRRW